MDLGSWIKDRGTGKNLFRIPDPGVKKAPDPQHCQFISDKDYGTNKKRTN